VSEEKPARVDGLEAHEVDEGLIVYQSAGDRVHYLNPTAAVVYELCTGERTVAEIATLVGEAWELTEAPLNDVTEVVAQLRDEGVVS